MNSNFRYKEHIPFVTEDSRTTTLYKNDKSSEIPIISYTQTAPKLREEYKDYSLVHFVPVSMWKDTLKQIGEADEDSYIRVFSSGNASLADLNRLEEEIVQLVSSQYEIESENRVQEQLSNDRLIRGMKVIWGAFCVLPEEAGICKVFVHWPDTAGNEKNVLHRSVYNSREASFDHISPHCTVCAVCRDSKLFRPNRILVRSTDPSDSDICSRDRTIRGARLLRWRKAPFAVRFE